MINGAILATLAAAAATVMSAQIAIAPPTDPTAPLSDFDIALGDAQTRLTVPVSIKDRGPWNFIIDTGAERTVVSRELAGILGLPAGPGVRVTAMTGTTSVATVIVPELSVSSISNETIDAPALESRNLGAPGMLGIDALQGHSVNIDFDRKTMVLKPAAKRASSVRHDRDDIVITARSLFGQLIVTDAHWRGKKIAVVIDTGSAISVGNPSLMAMMTKKMHFLGPVSMLGATGGTLVANAYSVDGVEIGGIGFENFHVAFADAPPFKRFGLGEQPALLLGMDALRLFRSVDIDFANREIRFKLPRGRVLSAYNG
ncbi:MAG: retroviral-like aspartic protease family protein [Pseudomonadota bacterium]|nr:retroviral-like aspartic protease family protein [Pseudomonadota bacterium]